MSPQRLQLRTEYKRITGPAIVKRLLPHAVAAEPEAAFALVPQSECEHAVESSQGIFNTPFPKRSQHDFGIGMAAKRVPAGLQFPAKIEKVVDFAIKDND